MPKPGFNPENKQDLQALYRADEYSYKKLEPFRKHNVRSIQQLAGQFYGENTDHVKVPINLLELAFTIYLRLLSGGSPRIHCSSDYRNLRPYAYELELDLNMVLKRIRFSQTIRAAVGNALLSMAPVKVGVYAGENIEEYSEEVFVDAIGLDNWVHDMTADCWGNVQYMGNEYTMVEEVAKETREFNRNQSAKLEAAEPTMYNETGDAKAQSVSVSNSAIAEEGRIHKVVRLKDMWLPKERLLVTIDANRVLDKPLRVVDFNNEDADPFEILSYCELQGNTMPLPPSALWMDLHRLANNIFTKLENQARNSRMITTFSGPEGEKDATRYNETGDGGACHTSTGSKPETSKSNEIDTNALAFLIQIKDLFLILGGNLEALGGLGPQSPTLGQDQLLMSGASQRLSEMHDRGNEFISRVVRSIAHYEVTGDAVRNLKKPVKGTNIEVDVRWDRKRRKQMGPLDQYQIDLVPYSTSGTTPGMKLQGMVNVFERFILPMLPSWQAEGYSLDPRKITEDVARLGNMPEIEGWITEGGAPIDQAEGQNSMPKPAQTKRTYERVNRPQSSTRTRDSVIMQSLMGKKTQPAEAGRMLGATG